jgi:hypothetical protein
MPERLAYDEAMQFSRIRLKVQDPELKQGQVEIVTIRTAAGPVQRPWGIEGGFAVVYKFRTKSGGVRALRCFRVTISPDMQFRYERIGPYFHTYVREITAGFKYYDAAIVVKEQGKPQNQAYPIVEMDWIDGVPLVDKIHELCRKRDRSGLKDLAEKWLSVLSMLHDAHIAHGDLSGVNAMIRVDGKMILVDYDGVYIPEFSGLDQVLLGQEDFQHPQMGQRKFHEHMDDFSALVIYTALVALAARPELWSKYATISPDGKLQDVNLLFRQQDFKDPQRSKLIRELEQINDQHVKTMVQELKRACLQPVNDVRFPFGIIDPDYAQKQALIRLESAIQANDDEQIVKCWLPILEQYAPAQRYRSRTQQAQQRVKALQVFRSALQTQNIQKIVDSYNAAQLDTCKNVTNDERQLLALARSFIQAYDTSNDDTLVTLASTIKSINSGITFTAQQQQRLTQVQQRKQALDTIRAAFNSKSIEQIAAAYPAVQQDKSLTQEERQRAELAVAFMQANKADDDAFLAAYATLQQSPYRSFFTFTPAQEQRATLVQKRKTALAQFQAALASRSPSRLVTAYDSVLDGSPQVSRTEREQLALARSLVEAFHADDDDKLIAADIALQKSTHQAFFVLTTEEQERIALARQQKAAWLKFKLSLNSRNAQQIVAAYDPILNANQHLLQEEREQLSVARMLVKAFDTDDDETWIAADEGLQKSSLRTFFLLTQQQQQRIMLAKERIKALETFSRALILYPKSAHKIVDAYDASMLDTSKSLTEAQRESITAARRYLDMYKQVQEGLRIGNDELVRKAYDSVLGQRFADFSPDEQKSIDLAMQSQALEELLDNREHGKALRMARTIEATTGREISTGLTFKLRRATMRFIREHDLTSLRVEIEERAEGNYAVVYWQWPEDDLVQVGLIAWRTDTWPETPERGEQDPEWNCVQVRRKNSILDDMCMFPIGTYSHIYVRGFTAILDTYDQERRWRFSNGDEPTSWAEATSQQMIWDLQ